MSATFPGFFTTDAKNARHDFTCKLTAPDLLVPNLQAGTKIGAIKELVDLLHRKGVVKDSLSFLQAVLEREALNSTILDDVALPHARTPAVNQMGMALGVARHPIDFPSGDERGSVQLLCLIAVPAHESDLYLTLLSTLARSFNDNDFKTALLNSSSSQDLYHLLSSSSIS